MRASLILLVTGLFLSGASAHAADYSGKTLETAPPAVTLQLVVPYSFSNVHKDLRHAVIRCSAKLGSSPQSPAIGAGETTIMLNGQPKTGTAIIMVNPAPGQKLSEAKSYTCGMQVSNGKMTIVPQLGSGPEWSKVQQGSAFMVSGKIP